MEIPSCSWLDHMALRVTREQEPVSSGVWIRRRQNSAMSDVIAQLEATIQDRKQRSQENSYTASLFKEGTARIAQKVGEEGVEVAIASLVGDDPQLISEMADLFYHSLVLLADRDLSWQHVEEQLASRFK